MFWGSPSSFVIQGDEARLTDQNGTVLPNFEIRVHCAQEDFMVLDPQYWAWLNAEWNGGRLMRRGVALDSFRQHPRTFLKKYPIPVWRLLHLLPMPQCKRKDK